MHSIARRSRFLPAGFSLIELMVGMALGLLSVLIITQVMSLFEVQRRSTTGSADAQTNGGIALFSIARDVQMAGYALLPATDSALECTSLTSDVAGLTSLTPLSISNGVAATGVNASDSITIRYGSSPLAGAVTQINSMAGAVATVKSNLACQNQVDGVTLVSSGPSCALSTTSAVSTVATGTVTLASVLALAQPTANLTCLGNWVEVTYAVNQATGNLDRTVRVNGVSDGSTVNNMATGTTPSVVGVVNLQAQYGIAVSANSNQVTEWVSASGGTWAAPTVANRNRIKAIRVAVIARNAKREQSAVSAACSSTSAAAPTGLCAWDATSALPNPVAPPFVASPAPAVDLSPGDANWANYRYRVFETIIPLRNVIWSKDTL